MRPRGRVRPGATTALGVDRAAVRLVWAHGLDPEAVAITAMNKADILQGLARLPDGRRKQQLQQSWNALAAKLFASRIWPFPRETAPSGSPQLRQREQWAQPMASADAVIATTALAHGVPWPPGTWPNARESGRALL